MKSNICLTVQVSLTALFSLILTTETVAAPTYLSPSSIVSDEAGKTLYITCATANQVLCFDTQSRKTIGAIAVPSSPNDAITSANGQTLYVMCGDAEGMVCVIDLKTSKITHQISVGHTPGGPVLSPDGKTLYVCNRFTDDVSVIDLTSNKQKTRIHVKRQPVAASLTIDGKSLLVANFLPTGPSDDDYVASVISVIDTSSLKVAREIRLINGTGSVRDIRVSPNGKYAAVTHVLARFNLPTSQVERGWMNANGLTLIDIASMKTIDTVLLDNAESGAANPWGAAWTKDGSKLLVAHSGSMEVSVIDFPALLAKFAKGVSHEFTSYISDPKEAASDDLNYLVGMQRRIPITPADNGPRTIAVIGDTAWVANYYSDTLCTFSLAVKEPRMESIALGPPVEPDIRRKGEMYFNDGRICFQKWQSCASCHPDARVDAYNWDLLNDGIGNPKNTKSMLLAHQTPPTMSLGIRNTAEVAVRSGIHFILFSEQPESVPTAIDEYLKSMKPVPSPKLVNGKLSNKALQGEKIFNRAGCSSCHPAGLFTDLQSYDVGTQGRYDKPGEKFDTPTLVEIWRTSPYLHDGSALTVRDVVTKHNPKDKHGKTSDLSPSEIDELCEYLLSL